MEWPASTHRAGSIPSRPVGYDCLLTTINLETRVVQADSDCDGRAFPSGETGASTGYLRALLDGVSDMVTVSDRYGRIVYANFATERVSGYTPEEFVSLDPFDSMHPEDRSRWKEAFERLASTPGLSLDLEHRVRHKDGTWRWVEGTFRSLFDDPEVGGLVATVRDVTERKRGEEELRQSEERHRLIVEGARDYAIITIDPEGRITGWSPGAEAVFGWIAEEILGQPVAITFTPEDREAEQPEIEWATARTHGSAPDVRWHLHKDGSRVFIEGTTRALRGGDGGEPRGFLKIGQDVTERRAMQEERERLRAVALTARAEQEERRRISRELHDRVAHTMTVAHQSLELFSALSESDPERAAERLALA